jgi:hypothetical protein
MECKRVSGWRSIQLLRHTHDHSAHRPSCLACSADGSFYMCTRIDPLFLALPLLEKGRKKVRLTTGSCSAEISLRLDH